MPFETRTKTRLVIWLNDSWWDTPSFHGGAYWVAHPEGGEVGYQTLTQLKQAVIEEWGGTLRREPNPSYRPKRELNPFDRFFSLAAVR